MSAFKIEGKERTNDINCFIWCYTASGQAEYVRVKETTYILC